MSHSNLRPSMLLAGASPCERPSGDGGSGIPSRAGSRCAPLKSPRATSLREVSPAPADLAAARIRVVVAKDQDAHHEGVYDDNCDSDSHD